MKKILYILSCALLLVACTEGQPSYTGSVSPLGCEGEGHYRAEEFPWGCMSYIGHYGEDFDSALDSLLRSYGTSLLDETLYIHQDTIHPYHPDRENRAFVDVHISWEVNKTSGTFSSEHEYEYEYVDNVIDTKGDVYYIDLPD